MPTIVSCPSCSRSLRVPDELLGKKVKCPSCSNAFVAAADAPPPEEEEEERPVAARKSAPRQEVTFDEEEPPPEDEEYEKEVRPTKKKKRRSYKPHRGVLVLVLGIVAFFVCGIIIGPIAWSMANADLREIRAGRMDPEGEGMTNAGRICGIIATILNALGLVCGLIYLVVVIVAVASGAVR
jgi:predicted Zn finger-like uncharacterized protein